MINHRLAIRRLTALVLLVCAITGCTTAVTPIQQSPAAVTSSAAQSSYFAIDQLVRSAQLEGIDMHLRGAQRTAEGITLQVAFYNNRGEDLASVRGIDPGQAQLVGVRAAIPSQRSASFETGIAPANRWVNGGANTGTLLFEETGGDQFELRMPSFPAIPFRLDQPAPSPVPVALLDGSYEYGLEVTSTDFENIALRVEQVTVQPTGVDVTVAFVNRNPGNITFTSQLTGNDAMLLDHQWQQHAPVAVEPALSQGLAPAGEVWPEDQANTGTITFPRPANGDTLLLAMPGFAMVRLPLQSDTDATVAQATDLPPSTQPRAAAATPTPRVGVEGAQDAVDQLLQTITTSVTQNDPDAYLAAFAPDLQSQQAEVFAQLGTLPLLDIRWEAVPSPDAVLSADGTVLSNYQVEVSYRVQDIDPTNAFVATLNTTLQQIDGQWKIVALDGTQPFWLYGPAAARRAGAFWVFYRPAMESEIVGIEQEAEQALEQVRQALPERVQATNVMFVTATEEEFDVLANRSAEQFLGVAQARFDMRPSGVQITNRAFFINGAAFQSDPTQDRQRTIAHELTHLVLSDTTMPFTPAWVSEGAAMLVTEDFPAEPLREQGSGAVDLATLSSQTSFGGDHGATLEETSIEYAYSAFLASYLVETYGSERYWSFYDSFAAVPIDRLEAALEGADGDVSAAASKLAPTLVAEQVQAAFGVDLATLEREYETWLRERLKG